MTRTWIYNKLAFLNMWKYYHSYTVIVSDMSAGARNLKWRYSVAHIIVHKCRHKISNSTLVIETLSLSQFSVQLIIFNMLFSCKLLANSLHVNNNKAKIRDMSGFHARQGRLVVDLAIGCQFSCRYSRTCFERHWLSAKFRFQVPGYILGNVMAIKHGGCYTVYLLHQVISFVLMPLHLKHPLGVN